MDAENGPGAVPWLSWWSAFSKVLSVMVLLWVGVYCWFQRWCGGSRRGGYRDVSTILILSGVRVAMGMVAVSLLWAARMFPRSAACWANVAIDCGVGFWGWWFCLCLLVRLRLCGGVVLLSGCQIESKRWMRSPCLSWATLCFKALWCVRCWVCWMGARRRASMMNNSFQKGVLSVLCLGCDVGDSVVAKGREAWLVHCMTMLKV